MGDIHSPLPTKQVPTQHHKAPKPRFIITGFGKFCGVSSNPTEQLVSWLQQRHCYTKAAASPAGQTAPVQHETQHKDRPEPCQAYCISSLDVLEVSADAVDSFMQKQQQALLQQAAAVGSSAEGPQPVVLLHFGVDTQRPAISLELQAYNNATFSCPDQCGWQPKACLIEAAPGLGTSSVRTTSLPLQELVQQLRDAGFECGVSRDAGRFVCNYTYYKSLQMSSKLQQQLMYKQQQMAPTDSGQAAASAAAAASSSNDGSGAGQVGSRSAAAAAGSSVTEHGWPCFSLFVHMPSFEVVNQARQREFVVHLLDLVAKWVAGGTHVATT